MVLGRISDRGLAKPSYLGVHQGFDKGEFRRGTEHLAANPSPIRQAIRTQRLPAPAGDQLSGDIRPGQHRAGQLVRVDDVEASASKHG